LKPGRNLYLVPMSLIATGIVAGGLLLSRSPLLTGGGLAERVNSGIGVGSRFAAYVQNWTIVLWVCCVVGVVGVIWLGWYCLKLTGEITSITRQLKDKLTAETPESKEEKIGIRNSGVLANFAGRKPALINELGKAINQCFAGYVNRDGKLEKQVNDLQIQIQLSQRQKRNAEAIIYSISDAVIVVDEFDNLLMANEAAGVLFNFDFRNSQHSPLGELIAPARGEFVDFLRKCRQGRVRHTRREMDFSEEGEPKIFDCVVSCVYDEREQICGVVAVLHDITREKEISQMKNDFVSHVSHELKTPLASITAYSEMLVDGEAEDEKTRREFYSVIQGQAARLNRLIEDILNVSRIESGLIKVDKRPVSLTILIEEQLQMIKGYAEEKSIRIVGQKPIIFDQVYVDKDMISQVIVNLLSNAVKYTPAGGLVKIETEVDEVAGVTRVSVTDTGVGIPENEIEHVFDKFYRVSTNKNQAKGTGLGLNLVRQIVEKVHNGRVFVTSKRGVGSTFGFELPLATGQTVESV